ncbi:MAG: response regulator [Nitrospirota bacterium]|nr:response regulator [Nitrospirota bacterium]
MNRKMVLVVDDDEVIREFLLFNLEDLGYRVVLASDGVEAVTTVIEKREVDFVVLDMMMPNLNGKNTLKILKQLKPELPVILCSGYLEMDDLVGQAREAGVVGCLSKPFSFAALESLLSAHS